MLIECHSCEAVVDAKELCTNDAESQFITDIAVGLYQCPSCHTSLVGIKAGEESYPPKVERVWPEPKNKFHESIPTAVRKSLENAKRCYDAKVYSATAVMCGKAIEFIVSDKTNISNLFQGLKELKAKEIIDARLYEWSEALRKERNIGAHAIETEINRQDANDILDFAVAICEYVYVLTDKYNAYLSRKENSEKQST
ncbi:MAG: DUF4145 domain-containing protein [Proteobacteria bacterium]|nr:DUF4145 domain-containing protein [Pseudomonadota bacterium]